jgi:hypothetical protein
MASTKELLAQKLKQNTEKHQQAQKDNIKELKNLDVMSLLRISAAVQTSRVKSLKSHN